MNVRKAIDYSELFEAVDKAVRATRRYGWAKRELTQRIAENAHMDRTLSLDTPLEPCYTDPAENEAEENGVQDTFLLPPHQRRTGQSRLSPGPPRARRTRRRLRQQNRAAAHTRGLSALRSADRHGRRKLVYPRFQAKHHILSCFVYVHNGGLPPDPDGRVTQRPSWP